MPLLEGIGTAYLRLSKYISKAAKKRIPLHRKNAGKGFYKGTGCAPTGRLTSLGEVFSPKAAVEQATAAARVRSSTRLADNCCWDCSGRFVLDDRKRIVLNVPDLTGFKVIVRVCFL